MQIKIKKKGQTGAELRKDIVGGSWVIMAPKRMKRHKKLSMCPFCHLEETSQEKPVLEYLRPDGTWSLVVIPNKFPSLDDYETLEQRQVGPFSVMNAAGFHEVIITRDHDRHIPSLSKAEVTEIISAYQDRYVTLMNKKFINYISIFHNFGKKAGASIEHPHSQLMALTVVDPDIESSLSGSYRFYQKNKKCPHCTMIDWELKEKERIVYENKDFVVLVPFVSRVPSEVRIYPKEHKPYFERISDSEKAELADALKDALTRLELALDNIAFNYFIHTAPCDGKSYEHYHWHLEIFPKISVEAGFEKGARMEIIPILPKDAAKALRDVNIERNGND